MACCGETPTLETLAAVSILREELLAKVNALNPTFCEMLPLTLEEIFINETEVAGYDLSLIHI